MSAGIRYAENSFPFLRRRSKRDFSLVVLHYARAVVPRAIVFGSMIIFIFGDRGISILFEDGAAEKDEEC